MSSDSYKIIISLSHHRIAFEYWLRDGEDKLVAMPNMTWPAPLAFYCSTTGIEIGDAAVRAVNSGTTNAFDNYFERLTGGETYLYAGQQKPLKYILLDACETVFEEFFRSVLFGNKGSLSDNRATMPVTLVCESDIKPNERVMLLDLFRDSGYNRFKVVEYNTFIERYLRKAIIPKYECNYVLVAWTEGADLTFTVFSRRDGEERIQACFPRLGVDPRIEYVKKQIWNRVQGQNPWLVFSDAEETISKAAADFLTSSAPLVSATLMLSGESYRYSLNRVEIDNLKCDEEAVIRAKLEEFLRANDLKNRNDILLFFRGIAAGNKFFEQTIGRGFSRTIRSDKQLRSNTMHQIIDDPNPVVVEGTPGTPSKKEPPIKEPPAPPVIIEDDPTDIDRLRIAELKRIWREVRADALGTARAGRHGEAIQILKDFRDKCSSIAGTDDLIAEVDEAISSLKKLELTPPPVDPGKIKQLKRRWREQLALAKGKVRNQQYNEAIEILNSFLRECESTPGSESIVQAVRSEIAAIPSQPGATVREPHKPAGKPKPTPTPTPDEGSTLIARGKLKEARDWYRTAGDTHKAKLLTDLIRSQKSVEPRKSSLNECKLKKNVEQIKRIITELQSYITLCNEVGYNCDDYKNLLSEYKKITK